MRHAMACLPPAYRARQGWQAGHSCAWLSVPTWRQTWCDQGRSCTNLERAEERANMNYSCFDIFDVPARRKDPCVTNYVAVVGPNTMWPGSTPAKLAKEGSDNDKILLIEITNSDINWMEPRDLTLEEALRDPAGQGRRHRQPAPERHPLCDGRRRSADAGPQHRPRVAPEAAHAGCSQAGGQRCSEEAEEIAGG